MGQQIVMITLEDNIYFINQLNAYSLPMSYTLGLSDVSLISGLPGSDTTVRKKRQET